MRLWVKWSWIVAVCVALGGLGCAGGVLPGPASAASPQTEEAPARPIATSLTRDPLSEEPAPAPGHEHHHAASAQPQPAAPAAPPTPGPTPPAADGGVPEAIEYVCPMHPDVREPKPGRCPRCGMTLVPKTIGAPGPAPKSEVDHAHAH